MSTVEMSKKHRVRVALSRGQPDRVPVFVTLKGSLARKMAHELGYEFKPAAASILENRLSHHHILTSLGNDAVGIGYCYPSNEPITRRADGTFVDEWGFIYKEIRNEYGVNLEIVGRPLSDIQHARDLARYRFPAVDAPGRWDLAREMTDRYGRDYALIGMAELTVFEYAWNLVGLEKFLVDLTAGADYVEPLLDLVMHFNIEVSKVLIELGADVILTGDDFGTQGGMLISPRLWRRHFKERLRRVFDACKKADPDVILAYHSCGSIAPIIPELIEIGMEVLNPIQPTAKHMDPARLKASYGNDLAFFGGLDIQHVIPFGSVDDVRMEVKRRIRELGHDGGYLLAPAHDIQPETPVENVLAIFEAAREFGTYPLESS